MITKYDVAIIGAGVGGLICGTCLAKNGFKVLVVEKHYKPGGCVSSGKRKGFNFDYGAHIFGSCNSHGILSYYLSALGIRDIDFIRIDPTERFIFPDQTIEVPQDIDEYIELLKRLYPKETNGIEAFFDAVLKIARSHSSNKLLSMYEGLTFGKLVKGYIKDERLMSILGAQFRYLGSSAETVAATSMCLMMVSYLRDGTYYPKGGAQSFPDALSRAFKKYGGTMKLKTEATKIILDGNRVHGLVVSDGETYKADTVISNCDASSTFSRLIDKKYLPLIYRKKINEMRVGSSFFMTFLGINDDVDLSGKSGWYHFSYGFNLQPDQSLYIFVPSLLDNSLAPQGKHVVELAMPFPYRFDSVTDWDACKLELRNKMMIKAETLIPGIEDLIEHEESATPRTIERYTGNANGSMFGWEMSADQVQNKRLSYNTPIDGLYLVGHWTNPGCGIVSVATSGWLVADKIMERARKHNN